MYVGCKDCLDRTSVCRVFYVCWLPLPDWRTSSKQCHHADTIPLALLFHIVKLDSQCWKKFLVVSSSVVPGCVHTWCSTCIHRPFVSSLWKYLLWRPGACGSMNCKACASLEASYAMLAISHVYAVLYKVATLKIYHVTLHKLCQVWYWLRLVQVWRLIVRSRPQPGSACRLPASH